MALAQIVHQILQALRQTCPLGFERQINGVHVGGEKIAGCTGRDKLLHGKLDAGFGFGFDLQGVGQIHHGA